MLNRISKITSQLRGLKNIGKLTVNIMICLCFLLNVRTIKLT